MRVKVVVTERDVRLGQRGSSTACPVARALRRRVKASRLCHIGVDVVWVGNATFQLPPMAQRFVEEFDYGLKPAPISFTINLPKDVLRQPRRTA